MDIRKQKGITGVLSRCPLRSLPLPHPGGGSPVDVYTFASELDSCSSTWPPAMFRNFKLQAKKPKQLILPRLVLLARFQ